MLMSVTAGAGAGAVALQGAVIYDVSTSPANAEAGYRLLSTGEEQTRDGLTAAWVTIGTWLLVGSAADYDIRWSGSPHTPEAPSAAINTWINLASGVLWTNVTDAIEDLLTAGTLEIRPAGGGASLVSVTLSLRAERAV